MLLQPSLSNESNIKKNNRFDRIESVTSKSKNIKVLNEQPPFLSDKNIFTKLVEQSSQNNESNDVPDDKSSKIQDESEFSLNKSTNLEVTVNTWDDFKKALQDTNITNVSVNSKLTANSNITVAGNKIIEFNTNMIDIKTNYITVSAPYSVHVSNLVFSGTNLNTYNFRGNGSIYFSGKLNSTADNLSNIASMDGGSITLDSLDMNFDNKTNTQESLTAKYLTITNQSNIVTEVEKFFGSTAATNKDGKILIDKQSTVTNNSLKNSSGNGRGQVWNLTRKTEFSIVGNGTHLSVTGDGKQRADNGGIFLLQADNSVINVLDGAHLDVHSFNTSAILLQSSYGVFNVDNNSAVNVVQDDDANYTLGAAIRFRIRGNMTFNISKGSKINVLKKKGTAPAIRMYGGNNKINISGASDFIVHNMGNGTYLDGGTDARNQGIVYTSGGGNSFDVKDEDSNISIVADYGPTIDSGTNSLDVLIDKGTYFVARGGTSNNAAGIFNSGLLNFQMKSVKYFDFRNTNKGSIFKASNVNSTFFSSDSNITTWKKSSNLSGGADFTWNQVDFQLKGRDLNTIDSSTSQNMITNWGATSNYSRISANNQAAIVDQLRIPTNADKSIFAHISIPEGKYDAPLPASNNTASLEISISNSNDNVVEKRIGTTQTLSIYGDSRERGWVQVNLSNGDFLTENYKVKVTSAWLGSGLENESSKISGEKNIKTNEVNVFGIIPPKPAIISNKIESDTKILNGSATPNTKVFLDINGLDSGITSVVQNDGKFSLKLPETIKKGDKLQILLQDNKGAATGVIGPPITNSLAGNIEPKEDLIYHDATFSAGAIIYVTGSLTLSEIPNTFDFGISKISNRESVIWPTIQGGLSVTDTRGSSNGWQVKLSMDTPPTSNTEVLQDILYYQNDGTDTLLGNNEIVVFEKNISSDGVYKISDNWGEDKRTGIKAKIPVEKQKKGNYTATLRWSLTNVPGNP